MHLLKKTLDPVGLWNSVKNSCDHKFPLLTWTTSLLRVGSPDLVHLATRRRALTALRILTVGPVTGDHPWSKVTGLPIDVVPLTKSPYHCATQFPQVTSLLTMSFQRTSSYQNPSGCTYGNNRGLVILTFPTREGGDYQASRVDQEI